MEFQALSVASFVFSKSSLLLFFIKNKMDNYIGNYGSEHSNDNIFEGVAASRNAAHNVISFGAGRAPVSHKMMSNIRLFVNVKLPPARYYSSLTVPVNSRLTLGSATTRTGWFFTVILNCCSGLSMARVCVTPSTCISSGKKNGCCCNC